MQKLVLLAIAVMFTFFAGEAAGEELLLTCVWDRGVSSIFELATA